MTKDDLPKCNPADRDEALLPPEKQLPEYKDGDCCTEGCIKCDARKVLAESNLVKVLNVLAKEPNQACKEALEQPTAEQSLLVQLPVGYRYQTPPSREWQSLSDAEIEELYGDCSIEYFRDIEAKLREKNG